MTESFVSIVTTPAVNSPRLTAYEVTTDIYERWHTNVMLQTSQNAIQGRVSRLTFDRC